MNTLRGSTLLLSPTLNKLFIILNLSMFINHHVSLYFSKTWRKQPHKSFVFKDHPEGVSLYISKYLRSLSSRPNPKHRSAIRRRCLISHSICEPAVYAQPENPASKMNWFGKAIWQKTFDGASTVWIHLALKAKLSWKNSGNDMVRGPRREAAAVREAACSLPI